ncbi:head maturation protease, ClpP-related [Sphingomonas immobilis]|uniref:ATP-dependent Clp protease proteolytic subunit n=1 Tax=Sphingomonas immobilis TaxID=3063997 RepID=A0ABT9A0T8_9SPHN|nr:head maturation protease, ClpP-related [Sphingomonas sp. CA1-15]MDO7843446.1 Clp protease ClpP [Sphingomonas sp. CA1-15]
MLRSGLFAVRAARPPEMPDLGAGNDWQFETQALDPGFAAFEVKALASDKPTISIFDRIGADYDGNGVTATRVAGALRSIGNRAATVEINSPGGNYFEGVAIYNLLRRHPAAIDVQILGIAASAASIIAMAGDTIAIAHNAEIMIHQAQGVFFGNADDMEAAIPVLRKLDGAMVDVYAARTGKPGDELLQMMRAETYIGGRDAVAAGFADTLMERDAEMPVYASADAPTDKASLDKFLATKGVPRSERRELYRAMGITTPRAADPDPATPRAGDEPEALARLLQAMSA